VSSTKKTQPHKRINSSAKPENLDKLNEPRNSNMQYKSVLNNSFDSDDKDSMDNSKTSHFIPSDTSTTGSIKSTKIAQNEEENSPSFLLPVIQNVNNFKMNINTMSNNEKLNQAIDEKNQVNQIEFKSSSSSFNDHDDDEMNFEDSLQDNSFDSDR